MSKKTYDEMLEFDTFEGRYEYLKLGGKAGVKTYGDSRYVNQRFYWSDEWQNARNEVIVRDNGCDLGIPGREINGTIYVHHINPINTRMVSNGDPMVVDLRNLVCVSYNTHKAIHYGDSSMLALAEAVTRTPNDTCPWKGGKL